MPPGTRRGCAPRRSGRLAGLEQVVGAALGALLEVAARSPRSETIASTGPRAHLLPGAPRCRTGRHSMTTDDQDDVRAPSTEQLDAFLAIVHPGYRTFFPFLAAAEGFPTPDPQAVRGRRMSAAWCCVEVALRCAQQGSRPPASACAWPPATGIGSALVARSVPKTDGNRATARFPEVGDTGLEPVTSALSSGRVLL
jgi:hypothetical protein